jgi:hypothetical protein
MQQSFIPTRAAALEHLARVLPQTGHADAEGRHTDRGPEAEPFTIALSLGLRQPLQEETDTVLSAYARKGPEN